MYNAIVKDIVICLGINVLTHIVEISAISCDVIETYKIRENNMQLAFFNLVS